MKKLYLVTDHGEVLGLETSSDDYPDDAPAHMYQEIDPVQHDNVISGRIVGLETTTLPVIAISLALLIKLLATITLVLVPCLSDKSLS